MVRLSTSAISRSILTRVANNDPAAVRECIEAYGPIVWTLARRFSPCALDAEDATQEIFSQLWRCADRFDTKKDSEQGFVTGIARRHLIDRVRHRVLEPATCLCSEARGDVVNDADDENSPQKAIDAQIAIHELDRLRPEIRQVMELVIVEGVTQSEIAVAFKMPLDTVKLLMRRGFLALRDAMIAE